MVGGKIIEVRIVGKRVRVWVVGSRREQFDERCIYLTELEAVKWMKPGDSIWWHGGKAFWTPANRKHVDVELKRVGGAVDPQKVDVNAS